MGLLRFSYGTMSSGKSTLALQIHHNLAKQSRHGLLLSLFDREGGRVSSRLGRLAPRPWRSTPDLDLCAVAADEVARHGRLDYLVCDEVQFYAVEQVDQLATIADEVGADVYAFGLLTDFRGRCSRAPAACSRSPTSGSSCTSRPVAGAGPRRRTTPDSSTASWSGEGETIVVGDTVAAEDTPLFGDVVTYELLCRRHFRAGLVTSR